MALPRPVILSQITVPTNGWALSIDISNGGAYSTNVVATVAAGNYFLSFDNQADDFAAALMAAIYTAFTGSGLGNYNAASYAGKPVISRGNLSYQTRIRVVNSREVRFNWSASGGPSIAAVLGFDSSAADSLTAGGAAITGDYQSGYTWAAADDGLLYSDLREDSDTAHMLQSVAISGKVRTQYVASQYTNFAKLQFLPADRTFSAAQDYGDAPLTPWVRNQGLECWWREARKGKPFRFYPHCGLSTFDQVDAGEATASSTTTVTEGAKAWTTDPQSYKGRILRMESFGVLPVRWHIASHTATVLTLSQALYNTVPDITDATFQILDQPYRTYVLDAGAMSKFEPEQFPGLDKYGITIPMRRYV